MSHSVAAKSAEDQAPVAFFDFDGTLTMSDTLMPFLRFVVGKPTYYIKLVIVSPIIMAYYAKLLRNDVAKQIILRFYLSGYHVDNLFKLGEEFGEKVIPTMIRPEGVGRLRWHQKQGHECVLVSASMDVYLNRWAENQLFHKVLCTSLEVDGCGYVSGRINGANCHGEEKLRRIKSFMGEGSCRLKYAYGDSSGDFKMLGYADRSFYLRKGLFLKYNG